MTSALRLFVVLTAFTALNARADDMFPQPPELQPDVDFWVAVFTRYSTNEGVLHDNRNLGVVYARLDMPSELSRRERNRRVGKARKGLQDVLRTLASGKRDNLTAEERSGQPMSPTRHSRRPPNAYAGSMA